MEADPVDALERKTQTALLRIVALLGQLVAIYRLDDPEEVARELVEIERQLDELYRQLGGPPD